MWSSASSDGPLFQGGGHVRPLTVLRSPAARRMRLAVDPRDGTVRLTLPRRASLRAATAWVEDHRAWIEAALEKLPAPAPFVPGASVPLEGVALTLCHDPRLPRTPQVDGQELWVGGPLPLLAGRVGRFLRARALDRLSQETAGYAQAAGVVVSRVAVGDPRGRWGSCSSSGAIRYSWRLILAPPDVRRATVAHEVAHRLHMDHSPAFHAAVAALFGRDPAPERAWLKAHGARLHWIGREG